MKSKSPLVSLFKDACFYLWASLTMVILACYVMLVNGILGIMYILPYLGMMVAIALPVYIIPTLWISIPVAGFLLLWEIFFLAIGDFDSKWKGVLDKIEEKVFRLKRVK